MPFGAHETMEVHEILNETISMINHFSLYAEHAQNPQVSGLVERHLQAAIQHYEQLAAYTHNYSAAGSWQGMQAQSLQMPAVSYQEIQYGLRRPSPAAPQMQTRFNDQQILLAVLGCHKNSAKNHMNASLECADPNVRQMLMNGAVACANFAYETFLIMNQQGQYQVPTMNDHTAKTFLHAYQPMQQSGSAGSYRQ